jgi:hypothetical protein
MGLQARWQAACSSLLLAVAEMLFFVFDGKENTAAKKSETK